MRIDEQRGCGIGCLLIFAACIAIDALAAYGIWSLLRWLFR